MPQASDTPFEIHGLKLRLPRWATYTLALILSLGTVIPVLSQVLYPMIQARVARAKVFNEYQRHFKENPASTKTVVDDPNLGSLIVSFYPSDNCLLISRKAPGYNQVEVSYWVEAKSIPREREAPPDTMDNVKESRSEPPPQSRSSLNATYQFASFNPISAPPPAESGTVACGSSHTGEFQTWNGEQKGCWRQVWRRWTDGCEHYQWYNTCDSYWDNHPDGTARVAWKTCIH
jgi:hypothetical protein